MEANPTKLQRDYYQRPTPSTMQDYGHGPKFGAKKDWGLPLVDM